MSKKFVYLFTEGNGTMRELLGGKGANLAEMTNIGMPVPQGFTISTEACTQYYEDGRQINADIQAQILEYVGKLEQITGKKFGDLEKPLLVSVRSGARASMPGAFGQGIVLMPNQHAHASTAVHFLDVFNLAVVDAMHVQAVYSRMVARNVLHITAVLISSPPYSV